MIIVYDLDGTLVDSRLALLGAHDAAWAGVGLERPSEHAILSLIGLPLRDIFVELAPEQDPTPLVEGYKAAYRAAAETHERLFDGIEALLARDHRAAVATGKGQLGAEATVARHGLTERFEVVLGGDAVPRPKPHPDLLEAIRERTGCDDLLMIGDTVFDLQMARAAGVPSIGVGWGHHRSERLAPFGPVAESVAELDELVQAQVAASR